MSKEKLAEKAENSINNKHYDNALRYLLEIQGLTETESDDIINRIQNIIPVKTASKELSKVEKLTKNDNFEHHADWIEDIQKNNPEKFDDIVADEETVLTLIVEDQADKNNMSPFEYEDSTKSDPEIIKWLNKHLAIQLDTACMTKPLFKRILEDNYPDDVKASKTLSQLKPNKIYDSWTISYPLELTLDQMMQNF